MKKFEVAEIAELNLSETANGLLPGWIEICCIFNNDLLHCGCKGGQGDDDNKDDGKPGNGSNVPDGDNGSL